jgi:hypothetical protein
MSRRGLGLKGSSVIDTFRPLCRRKRGFCSRCTAGGSHGERYLSPWAFAFAQNYQYSVLSVLRLAEITEKPASLAASPRRATALNARLLIRRQERRCAPALGQADAG